MFFEVADVGACFYFVGEFNEGFVAFNTEDGTGMDGSGAEDAGEGGPGVFLELLVPEFESSVSFVVVQDDGFNLLSFLEDLGGMGYVSCPGEVAVADESLDTVFQFYESALGTEFLDSGFDARSGWVACFYGFPGVGF